MKSKLIFTATLVCLIFAFVVTSCATSAANNKDEHYQNIIGVNINEINVYIAGTYKIGDRNLVCLWKNGQRIRYFIDEESRFTVYSTNAIAVSGDKVYLACNSSIYYNPFVAYYIEYDIKNDIEKYFSLYQIDKYESSFAKAICVVGSDVYVAGYYTNSNTTTACYWKNGELVSLQCPNNTNGNTNAISISNSEVYVTGWYSDGRNMTFCYWKNGQRTDINSSNIELPEYTFRNEFSVDAITTSGGKIFVAGSFNHIPGWGEVHQRLCYWIDGKIKFLETYLERGSHIDNINVSDNSVFVTGGISIPGDYIDGYWKNEGFHQWYINDIIAITDLKGKTYIAGNNGGAHYWIDEERYDFQDGDNATITAIAVVEE